MFVKSRLERLKEDLEARVGTERAAEILRGYGSVGDGTPPEVTGAWFAGFAGRLDYAGEPEKVAEALQCGSCRFGHETVTKAGEIWASCGGVREFAEEIVRQNVFGRALAVRGDILYVTKRPICDCDYSHGFTSRYSRLCHCPLACTAPGPMSKTFCHCGGGYYRKLFDGLWGGGTKVEPVSTYIAGSAACVFAVHIPERAMAAGAGRREY